VSQSRSPHRDSTRRLTPLGSPDAPAEFRGSFQTIRTKVPGIQVSDLLPRLARIADKYTIIRSCTTGDGRADHGKDSNYNRPLTRLGSPDAQVSHVWQPSTGPLRGSARRRSSGYSQFHRPGLYWFSLKWKIAGFELASKG